MHAFISGDPSHSTDVLLFLWFCHSAVADLIFAEGDLWCSDKKKSAACPSIANLQSVKTVHCSHSLALLSLMPSCFALSFSIHLPSSIIDILPASPFHFRFHVLLLPFSIYRLFCHTLSFLFPCMQMVTGSNIYAKKPRCRNNFLLLC